MVVAVGGDGTLNEVVNGLMQRDERPVLATIPLGTGMDFVRTYGISDRFEDAVRVAAGSGMRTIDVGRVEHSQGVRYFANVASVGMSAAVARRANGMSKALGGKATFFYALTRVFLEWQNTSIEVDLADGTRREMRMHDVIVANGRWHGGAMHLAPDALPDDGHFDVVLIGDVTKRDFVTTAPKIYKGTYLAHPKVELLRSPTVAVRAPEHLPIELDGEQVGTTPARFEIVPRALRIRVP
jgi:YegS/Rv2252/BmrU family lipid kinase